MQVPLTSKSWSLLHLLPAAARILHLPTLLVCSQVLKKIVPRFPSESIFKVLLLVRLRTPKEDLIFPSTMLTSGKESYTMYAQRQAYAGRAQATLVYKVVLVSVSLMAEEPSGLLHPNLGAWSPVTEAPWGCLAHPCLHFIIHP